MALLIPHRYMKALMSAAWNGVGQLIQNDLEGMKNEARQLDAFSKQSDSIPGKSALKVMGLAYSAATLPQRTLAPLPNGTVDFMATVFSDPVAAAKSIPESVLHNGGAMQSGAIDVYNGNTSAGLMSFGDGFIADFLMCAPLAKGMTKMGIFKEAVPVAEAPLARQLAAAVQTRAESALQKILVADDAAFDRAWNNTATAGTRGALRIPQWLLRTPKAADLIAKLRSGKSVSNADLQALTQHANASVASAARQILAERATLPPEGYMPIPGGEFKGQTLSPFAMKATPVTNGEWFLGVDGKPRFVQLVEDPITKVIRVEDVMAQPPSSVSPMINFDAGQLAIEGSKVLVKLVDNPSAIFDDGSRMFSGKNQPVVGVNYYRAQAWVLTDASGRLMLPTNLQWEAMASDFGKREFGTATGELYGADGRKLAHFDEPNGDWRTTTADVNDPRYLAGPFGVQSTGNVWRWMQADPQIRYSYGLRGGAWNYSKPNFLRPAYPSSSCGGYSIGMGDDTGFQPAVSLGLPKALPK